MKPAVLIDVHHNLKYAIGNDYDFAHDSDRLYVTHREDIDFLTEALLVLNRHIIDCLYE